MIELAELIQTGMVVLFGTLGLVIFGIFFGLVYKGIDRKLAAHMQGRIGPPIRQPFRDVRKLFVKENIVPENAIPWIAKLLDSVPPQVKTTSLDLQLSNEAT